jgi:RNA polymerase sigma-70 factor, ECF subfamily
MDDTSVSLLERIAARNLDEDWQRLLTIYQPFIEVQVRRYPQLAEEVDDVVQNICMVLVRELPEFQRQRTGSFRKWLRLVTVNQLRITARKLKNRPRPESDIGALELGLDQLLDPTSPAARQWDLEHDRRVLEQVIEIVRPELNPVHWQAFQWHVLDDRTAVEVARDLGISVNMVHLVKSRIKRRMQIEIQGLLED